MLEEGIFVDLSKIQDVLSWNTPDSVTDIRSFLELVRYYRKFIEGFPKITKPMTELLGRIRSSCGRPPVKLYFRN
jgi:predicted phosphatase